VSSINNVLWLDIVSKCSQLQSSFAFELPTRVPGPTVVATGVHNNSMILIELILVILFS